MHRQMFKHFDFFAFSPFFQKLVNFPRLQERMSRSSSWSGEVSRAGLVDPG